MIGMARVSVSRFLIISLFFFKQTLTHPIKLYLSMYNRNVLKNDYTLSKNICPKSAKRALGNFNHLIFLRKKNLTCSDGNSLKNQKIHSSLRSESKIGARYPESITFFYFRRTYRLNTVSFVFYNRTVFDSCSRGLGPCARVFSFIFTELFMRIICVKDEGSGKKKHSGRASSRFLIRRGKIWSRVKGECSKKKKIIIITTTITTTSPF